MKKNKMIILIFILVFTFIMNVSASVPVTYTCCKNYTYSNGIQLSDFENITDWVGNYKEPDTTNFKEGQQGLKLMAPAGDTAYSDLDINVNFSNVNNLVVWAYVDNPDHFSTYFYVLITSDKANLSGSNQYCFSRQRHFTQGWNKIVFNKNDFNCWGGENWNNVMNLIRLRVGHSSEKAVNITFDDLRYNMSGQKAKLIIEFDDGYDTVYKNAYPILKANNQTGVSFVVTSRVYEEAPLNGKMNLSYLKTLQSAGWDISSHTSNHINLVTINDSEQIYQINNSFDWLVSNQFQKSAGYLAYPWGDYNDTVIDKVKKRYVLGRTTDERVAQQHFISDNSIQYTQRVIGIFNYTSVQSVKDNINAIIDSKLLGILVFHSIGDPSYGHIDYSIADFEEISNYIKSRSSDIDVITYSDYVIANINNFTPILYKNTQIYSNGSSVLLTNNKYDEYMPNMIVRPSSDSIIINITTYDESGENIKFNETSPNSNIQVSYILGDRIPNHNYSVKIYWANGTKYQDFNILANSSGFINYSSTGFENARYQEIKIFTGTISGTVINANSNLAILGTTVTDGTRSATTDTNGNYTISNIPAGTYSVTASASGYQSFIQPNINVVANQNTPVNFNLSPDLSLKAHWRFDENTGTTATDSSGNSNDGTISGATWTTGKIGNALSFDGVNDYVDTGNGASLNITGNQMTIEAWVYPESLSENYIVGKFPGDIVTSGYNLLVTDNRIFFRLGDGTTGYQFFPVHGMATDTWYHIVAVYDGTSMKVYKNGTELPGSTPFSGNIGTNTYNVNIGQRVGNKYRWNGNIDDVKIYNRALSASEILADYNAGVINVTSQLGAPNITSFTPVSSITDTQGETRLFNITVNQTVNVTWYINGSEKQTEAEVNESTYIDNTAPNGTWNVSAVVENINGTTMQTWMWYVNTMPVPTPEYIPPTPVNLINTTGEFWVNHSWTANLSGNVTDSYNVSVNGTWYNGTDAYFNNTTVGPQGWSNITVWAYNNSGSGSMSLSSISQNIQAPASPVPIPEFIPPTPVNLINSTGEFWINHSWTANISGNITDSYNVSVNDTWYNGTATYFNNTAVGPQGWSNITVWAYNNSGSGSMSLSSISQNTQAPAMPVSVSEYIPPAPVNLVNSTGEFWINHSWTANISGNITDSYNVSVNGTWYNGTHTYFNNTAVSPQGWSNITVWAYNNSGSGSMSLSSISQNTQAPASPVPIPEFTPAAPVNLVNSTGEFWVNHSWTANVSGNITDSYNVSVNGTWYNGTATYFNNTVGPQGWSNITVWAYNNSGSGSMSLSSISQNTQAPAIPVPVSEFIPPAPVNLINSTGEFWINHSWQANISGNVTDSYNVSVNGTWYNSTDTYYNNTAVGPQGWSNITVWAYNNSESGSMSLSSISQNTQASAVVIPNPDFIPPAPVNLVNNAGEFWVNHSWTANLSGNITDSYNVSVNGIWHNGTDTYYNNTAVGPQGWSNITVWAYNNSGSGSMSLLAISQNTQAPASPVPVSEYIPPAPVNLVNSSGEFWVNHSWTANISGNVTDSYNVSVNGTWYNGTDTYFNNTAIGPQGWSNITVWAYNNSGSGSMSLLAISQNTQAPASPVPTPEFIPPAPVNLMNNTGEFWINHSWAANISGNVTDNYNVNVNGTWYNGTDTYFNNTAIGPQGWSNITVWAYNNSGSGSMSLSSISQNTQAPASPVPIPEFIPSTPVNLVNSTGEFWINHSWTANLSGNITDGYNVSVNGIWYNGTDTYYNNTAVGPQGWSNITVWAYNNSGSGSMSLLAISQNTQAPASQIPVSEYIPPTPVNLINTTGEFWVNHSWQANISGNITDSYNVSVNGIWYNGTDTYFNNTAVGPQGWSNITVWAYNNSGSGSMSLSPITQNTQRPAMPVPVSEYIPPTPVNLINTTGEFWVNHSWQANISGNITDSYNVSVNGIWYNGTDTYYNNTAVGPQGWSNITVWAYNNSGSGSMSLLAISQNTQAPAAPIPTQPVHNINTGNYYTTIQAAIDNASAGDEIQVDSGTYYENVNVNKQLILRGIGMPVVNTSGSGTAINLSADGITLDGFTATGGGNAPEAGIKVISNNNTLSGNNASSNNYNGIDLYSSSNNTLSGNNASSNSNHGINLLSSSNNTLNGNNASSNNYYGIHLFGSNNNTLSGNNANSNNVNGIRLHFSNNNTLSGNNASSNNYNGIDLDSSSNNTLNGNNASNNYNGIHLHSSFSSNNNNTLIGNNANSNNYGIYLDSSSSSTLSSNTASSNKYHGIILDSSSNNTIYNNIFNNTNNIQFYGSNFNTWNISLQSGINIIGGQNLGGNFWVHPNSTGFSLECSDDNVDGICNSNYTLNSNNIDYLPLTANIPAPEYIPPAPVNLVNSTGEFWVNHSWTANSLGNVTDSYNVSINGTWYNSTDIYFNNTAVGPQGWSNITIWAYNNSGSGSMSLSSISQNTQAPAMPLSIPEYIPPAPVNLINSTGEFWVNHSWAANSVGNVTDSYNVSVNGTWYNGTDTYFNNTAVGSQGWSNITVWAYNNSGSGSMSLSSISQNTQAPAN